MNWLEQAAIIVGMFILRLGVPLLIMLTVGYWLRRLDAKWQSEARTRLEANRDRPNPGTKPAIEMFKVISQPCWVLKGCPESIRRQCPAFQHLYLPCWMARRQVEGRVPAECYHCELFSSRQLTAHRQN